MRRGGEAFRVRFWGVRGSYPTSDSSTRGYGGHTSCVEVTAGRTELIFDAGTGLIALGKALRGQGRARGPVHLFLSHTHLDHVCGLSFFEPLSLATSRIHIFGPGTREAPLRRVLSALVGGPFFPVGLEAFEARKRFWSLRGGEVIRLGSRRPKLMRSDRTDFRARVLAHKSHAHPREGVMLYRVSFAGKSLVYATDIEESVGGHPDVIAFARDADLLIHDAQYLESEYPSRRGWGHSTVERAAETARNAQVGRLVLFHHEPTHDDRVVARMERIARRIFPASIAAAEGLTLDL